MKHGFFNILTEVNNHLLTCNVAVSVIKDAAETDKTSNKLWSSNTISHPYLALYNERWWWFHSGLFLFDSIKSASLQLLFTLCARTHCLRLSAYCISLSVWDASQILFSSLLSLSLHVVSSCWARQLASPRVCDFSISCVLIFPPVQLRCPARPGG